MAGQKLKTMLAKKILFVKLLSSDSPMLGVTQAQRNSSTDSEKVKRKTGGLRVDK